MWYGKLISFHYDVWQAFGSIYIKQFFMKMIFTFLIATFILPCMSFVSTEEIDDVVSALNKGDAATMAKFFDNNVEISVLGKTGTYNTKQAESILKDFFDNNPIESFEMLHKGENNGATYCTGNLKTKNGVYRTTVFMKIKGDKNAIQTLRFELLK